MNEGRKALRYTEIEFGIRGLLDFHFGRQTKNIDFIKLLTSKIHGNFTYINKTEMYVNFNSS
jgi:hypothetical protein